MKTPGANAIAFRRYDNELRESVFGQLQWAAVKLEVEGLWRFMVSPMQAIYEPTGQRVLFKGSDNPLKIKSINLGKGYIKYAFFEECDQYGSIDEIRNILQSVFRGENHKRIALFSYNPPKSSRSWVNREVRLPKPGRLVHSSDYRSVDPNWLGERFIADAEHLLATNETAYRHEYLGEEVGTGLEIFNNVNVRVINDDEVSTFDHIRQGLDFGYAVDPLSFERAHYDAKKRRLYLFREVSGIGISNRVLASKLTEQEKHDTTIADSAEPKSVNELRNDYGLKIIGARKGPGSVEHGVKWLSDLEEIVIDPVRAPLAAKEFVNYALETRRDGEVISRYPDKDNHCLTGDTLVMTDNGQKRIDSIKEGDIILTRSGYRKCTKAWKVFDNVPVFTVFTDNNRSITGTASHKILANGVFARIDTVRYGDVLLSLRRQPWLNQKLSFLKVTHLFAGLSRKEEQIGSIIGAIKSKSGCMMQYGNRLMGLFLSDITSITKIAIRSIIGLKTSNALIQRNMQVDIHGAKNESKNSIFTSMQSETLQKSGTHQKKVRPGIVNMQKRYSVVLSRLKRNAHNVGSNSIQSETESQIGFAQIHVNQNGEENQVSMMSNECAKNVGRHSRLISIQRYAFVHERVLSVLPTGEAAVYDLTVEGEHEFFANGILVHNSIDSVRYGLQDDIGSRSDLKVGALKASDLGL